MIVNNSLDEVKKRENALSIIKNIIETEGRSGLYDLTGLAGGFIASSSQLSLLETYVGPAIFEDEIQEVGKRHLGGEKILPLNRTSSGILATVLSLVDKGSNVVHYLAQLPAHPSIPRSCELVGANYFETDDFDKFEKVKNTMRNGQEMIPLRFSRSVSTGKVTGCRGSTGKPVHVPVS